MRLFLYFKLYNAFLHLTMTHKYYNIILFSGSNPVYNIKSIKHCRFLPFHKCLSIVWDSGPMKYCILSSQSYTVYSFMWIPIYFLMYRVTYKSHCSLPLADPNTLYLAFRYPLLSFSLNCSTIYSP